jgi:hypothetical protein
VRGSPDEDLEVVRLRKTIETLKDSKQQRMIELTQDTDGRQPSQVWFEYDRALGDARFKLEQSSAVIERTEPELERLANRLVQLRSARRRYSECQRELDLATQQNERAQEQVRIGRDKRDYAETGISALRPSEATIGERSSPTPIKYALLGLVAGAGAIVGLLGALGFIDRRLHTGEDLGGATKLPVLAVFPAPRPLDVRRHIRNRQLHC